MRIKKLKSYPDFLFIIFSTAFLLVFFIIVSPSSGSPQANPEPTTLERTLPSGTCPGGVDDCHLSSPSLIDFDGDGKLDILLATNNGVIMVIKDDGSSSGNVLLTRDIANDIPNMAAGTEVIASSPAVGDIDLDGKLEIVVGFGSIHTFLNKTRGGMIVIEYDGTSDGKLESGWPQYSQGSYATGYEQTIFSTPAIGDLDNDGDLEIVAGGFDKRLYAWHHNGQLMAGFPPSSDLLNRFPTWTDLVGKLADTTWSSPALADMDGDGYLDIIIGTAEGNFDDRYGGDSGGWTCPYQLPDGWAPGYCGGSVYVVNHLGEVLPGFPQYRLESFQSSPAIADLDEDGMPDIVIGTGDFYYTNSPDKPTYGFKVYAWDGSGNDLAGWAGGKSVGGTVGASPVIGDIAGDARPEVIVAADNGALYAWHHDGTAVSGFPMWPKEYLGKTTSYGVGISFILADYDGDDKMEIFFKQSWSLTIVDGDGTQITTANDKADGKPMYRMNGSIYNNPAVGDIDGNGKLDLIVQNSDLKVWELPNSVDNASWPMFKKGVTRQSCVNWPLLAVNPNNIALMHLDADTSDRQVDLLVKNSGSDSFNWTVAASDPSVSVTPTSGTVTDQSTVTVTIPTGSLGIGTHDLGTINVSGTTGTGTVMGSPKSTSITVIVVNELHSVYLPTIQK